MLIQPVDYFLVAWFILAGACTAYVAIDQYRNNPEPVVMIDGDNRGGVGR